MTTGSSKGWQNTYPAVWARSTALVIASSSEAPASVTIAPKAREASILLIGAPAGTKISHFSPAWRAAEAMDWAWLPALAAVMPFTVGSARNEASLFVAPLILNDPVSCRFSALSTMRPPQRSERDTDGTTGVRLTTGKTTSAATRIASRSTALG